MTIKEITEDPVAYIAYLTDNIRDGKMRFPDWNCPEDPLHEGVEEIAVREGTQYRDAATLQVVNLLAALRRIAPHVKQLRDNPETAGELLDASDASVWDRYVRPLRLDGIDRDLIYEILGKEKDGEALTPEEDALYKRYNRLIDEDVEQRLGKDNPYAFDEIRCATRYCWLVSYPAPKRVINHSACWLAEYVLLEWCSLER